MSNTKVTKQVTNTSFNLSYDFNEGCYRLEVEYYDGSGDSIQIEKESTEDFISLCEVVANGGLEL